WNQELQYDLPSPSFKPLRRISCYINMVHLSENAAALSEVRELIALHLLLAEFDGHVVSLDNSTSRHGGTGSASAVIKELRDKYQHKPSDIDKNLKRARRL